MASSVLVMAKAPRPGTVKTRLEPLLGAEGCAALQAELIAVCAGWAASVSPGRAHVACGPDAAAPGEVAVHAPDGVEPFADGSGDLGDRLAAASARVLADDGGPVVVIGTDMPLLRAEDAGDAERALNEGADIVLGPALDGGYWLIAVGRPLPELFALGGEWGGGRVLERTLAIADGLGAAVALLDRRRDLDDPADAAALLAEPELPPTIAAILMAGAPR